MNSGAKSTTQLISKKVKKKKRNQRNKK